MKRLLKKLRSNILVMLTHTIALPILKIVRRKKKFPYSMEQLSVLPYASSAGSVAIRPTKEGVIKHKALSAMEDQTNMQLNQIKEQIELLARQAQEIRKRKELSMMIYEAKITFKPQIGQVYHVYEKQDGSHVLSMVAPHEWGGGAGPFAQFIATVKLLADHTWIEVAA